LKEFGSSGAFVRRQLVPICVLQPWQCLVKHPSMQSELRVLKN
jgi:hypothetical protein